MDIPRIGIILSTTRAGRFADKPAAWLLEIARRHTDLSFELVDLRDYPLPPFDWPHSPERTPVEHDDAIRWRNKLAALDGFIFITAEYNRSIPATLKNAIEHSYAEWNRKPAAYVGYGSTGAARAVEHLRTICVDLQVAPVRPGVHIGRDPLVAILNEGRSLTDFAYLEAQATRMLDDLSWWTWTLKAGREMPRRAA